MPNRLGTATERRIDSATVLIPKGCPSSPFVGRSCAMLMSNASCSALREATANASAYATPTSSGYCTHASSSSQLFKACDGCVWPTCCLEVEELSCGNLELAASLSDLPLQLLLLLLLLPSQC